MKTLVTALLLTFPPPAQPDKAQPDKDPLPEGKDHGIQCQAAGEYIGNAINPVFSLMIRGGKDKTWEYHLVDKGFGFKVTEELTARGTYELDGNLAVFTGKTTQGKEESPEYRFALNFGHAGKQVTFNRFFPVDGAYQYSRRWYQKVDGKWMPKEEHRLVLKADPPKDAADTWSVSLKGERIQWDAKGEKSVAKVDTTLAYKKSRADHYYLEKPPQDRWLPGDLILQRDKDRIQSIAVGSHWIGDLRGFSHAQANREPPK